MRSDNENEEQKCVCERERERARKSTQKVVDKALSRSNEQAPKLFILSCTRTIIGRYLKPLPGTGNGINNPAPT